MPSVRRCIHYRFLTHGSEHLSRIAAFSTYRNISVVLSAHSNNWTHCLYIWTVPSDIRYCNVKWQNWHWMKWNGKRAEASSRGPLYITHYATMCTEGLTELSWPTVSARLTCSGHVTRFRLLRTVCHFWFK